MTEVVLVQNIQNSSNLKPALTEYFNFCGEISSITLHKGDAENTVTAIVRFAGSGVARTAILMNNTPFQGRNITVTNLPDNYTPPPEIVPSGTVQEAVPAAEPIPGSPEAILQDLLKQARAIDEQHGITATITAVTGEAVQQAQTKFQEIDKELQLTTKAAELGKEIEATFTALDQQYKITEATQQAKAATEAAFSELAVGATKVVEQLSQDPNIKEGLASLESWGEQTGKSIKEVVDQLATQAGKTGGATTETTSTVTTTEPPVTLTLQ